MRQDLDVALDAGLVACVEEYRASEIPRGCRLLPHALADEVALIPRARRRVTAQEGWSLRKRMVVVIDDVADEVRGFGMWMRFGVSAFLGESLVWGAEWGGFELR